MKNRELEAGYGEKIHPEWDSEKLALEVARRLSHGTI